MATMTSKKKLEATMLRQKYEWNFLLLVTNKQISMEALRRNLILIENFFALWSMEIWAKVAEIGINWMVTCKKKICAAKQIPDFEI
jgi:hypothetical protein